MIANSTRFLVLCVLVVSSGCATVNTVEPKQLAANRSIIADKQVITDPILNVRAQILSVNETITLDGFVKVQVEIRNPTKKSKQLEYLFEWFDEHGNLAPSTSSRFQMREILGGETIFLTSISPNRTAKDFKLKLIRARN